jgi:hypothetical protein
MEVDGVDVAAEKVYKKASILVYERIYHSSH